MYCMLYIILYVLCVVHMYIMLIVLCVLALYILYLVDLLILLIEALTCFVLLSAG